MTYYLCLFREAMMANKFNTTVIREDPTQHFDEKRDWFLVDTFESSEEINAAFEKKNAEDDN